MLSLDAYEREEQESQLLPLLARSEREISAGTGHAIPRWIHPALPCRIISARHTLVSRHRSGGAPCPARCVALNAHR